MYLHAKYFLDVSYNFPPSGHPPTVVQMRQYPIGVQLLFLFFVSQTGFAMDFYHHRRFSKGRGNLSIG